jgi:hypothetical protein
MADAIEDHDAKSGAVQTAKDLFSGAAGGVAQVLLGSSLFYQVQLVLAGECGI